MGCVTDAAGGRYVRTYGGIGWDGQRVGVVRTGVKNRFRGFLAFRFGSGKGRKRGI